MKDAAHSYTYNDLYRWSNRVFEKLGWMVLAYRDDQDHKVYAYLRDLDDLSRAIEARVVSGPDSPAEREDILIIYKNLYTLRAAADKMFSEVAGRA